MMNHKFVGPTNTSANTTPTAAIHAAAAPTPAATPLSPWNSVMCPECESLVDTFPCRLCARDALDHQMVVEVGGGSPLC